jgi:hypothetical protein
MLSRYLLRQNSHYQGEGTLVHFYVFEVLLNYLTFAGPSKSV